jgi:hypothetical protein
VWACLSLLGGLGVAIGATIAFSEWAVARLRPRPLRAAAIRAASCLPVLVPLAQHLFEGAFAQTLPGASLAPVLVPLLGWLALTLTFWPGSRLLQYPRPESGLAPLRAGALPSFIVRRRLMALAAITSALVVEYANRRFLRGVYPDIHTTALVVTCVGVGLGVWLGLTRPWLYDSRVERRLAVAQSRAIVLALLISIDLAVTANLAACLVLGLPTHDARLAISERGLHTRLLVRVARGLVDQDRDGHSPCAAWRRLRRPQPGDPPRRARGPRQPGRRGLRRLRRHRGPRPTASPRPSARPRPRPPAGSRPPGSRRPSATPAASTCC